MAMFEFMVPAGAKVPVPHYHEAYDETIYGLEGTVTFTVDGKPVNIGSGQTHFIPRGVVHGFNNFGSLDAKALAVITPGILGPDFFKEAGEIINRGGPPDLQKLKGVLLKHGWSRSCRKAEVPHKPWLREAPMRGGNARQ